MPYAFETFRVDANNQAAFDRCRDVADLKPMDRLPVILHGPQGCGKTHLLYAIVSHVRAHHPHTALAFVTATRFPQDVKNLIQNPAPIVGASSAILLVDQLDAFSDNASHLEALTNLFLDNGHRVVMAGRMHPDELTTVSQRYRSRLNAGQILAFDAKNAPAIEQPLVGDLVRDYQEENHRLREELLAAKEKADIASNKAALAEVNLAKLEEKAQQELEEAIQREQAETFQAVALAKEEIIRKAALEKAEALGKIESEKKDLQGELDQVRLLVNDLRHQLQSAQEIKANLNHELTRANQELSAILVEREEVAAMITRLEATVSELTEGRARVEREAAVREEALMAELKEAQARLTGAETENNELAQRMQDVLARIQQQTDAHQQAFAVQSREIQCLEQALVGALFEQGLTVSASQPDQSEPEIQAENVSLFPDRGQVA